MGNPLKAVTASNKNNDLLNSFSVEKSLFYSLCQQANSVCGINYDTITLIDLFGFVAMYCKNTYIDISLHKRAEAQAKSKQMMQKMGRLK